MKLEQLVETHSIPAGTYPAKTSGYTSVFTVGDKTHRATFSRGVRGMNITDTISVTADQQITSGLLGPAVTE